jgi:hypothetical protein
MPAAAPIHRLRDAQAAMARPNPSGRRREPEMASLRGAVFWNDTSAGIALAPVRSEGSAVPNTTNALKDSCPGMENANLSIDGMQAPASTAQVERRRGA